MTATRTKLNHMPAGRGLLGQNRELTDAYSHIDPLGHEVQHCFAQPDIYGDLRKFSEEVCK
jgi:hypothetical protein